MYQGICGKLSWCKWRRHDDDMTTTCPWHGDSIATALRRHGDDTATTWRRLGDGIATTWRRHGDHMATTWRPHGDDMATTWRRHGDDMATTWRRHGDVARTTTTTVRTTMAAMTRTTATITRQSYIGYGVDIDIHMAMVWWCRSTFVTTKSVFRMFFPRWAPCFLNRARLNGCVSCAGSIQLELCSINGFETTAVFFWQPMSSHVAKVTTWTNLVNLNSGFFDVSVHKYIPRQEGWIRRTMQGTNGLLFFDPPPCPEMNPFCLELGVRKKCFPFMWFLKPLPICLASVGRRSVGFLPSPTVRLDFRFQLVSRRESRLHLYSTLWNLFRFKGV